jgi:class 3 adenylate cyclase
LDRHDDLCRIDIGVWGGRWVKSTGDGILATFDSPSRAVRWAWALTDRIRSELGIEIRAGLHTGEIETRGDDVAGMSAHQAARVQGLAGNSEVLVSARREEPRRRFRDQVGQSRGARAEGISEKCQLYCVLDITA